MCETSTDPSCGTNSNPKTLAVLIPILLVVASVVLVVGGFCRWTSHRRAYPVYRARGRPSSPSSTLEEVRQKEEQDNVVPTPEMYEVNAKLSAGALDVGTTWKGLEPLSVEVARKESRRATRMFPNRSNIKRKDIVSATALIAMPTAGREDRPEMEFGTMEAGEKVAI